MDYYEVLGLTANASNKDIKQAYKNLVLKYHPDKNKDSDSNSKFININTAYNVLVDARKRQEYDSLTSFEKMELYDYFKNYIITILPQYSDIYHLIEKYYGYDERDLRNDINTFNFKNIYNKFFVNKYTFKDAQQRTEFSEFPEAAECPIPLYNPQNLNLDLNYVLYTNLRDRYLNKYKRFTIKNISEETHIISVNETEVIIPDGGKRSKDGKIGDLIIKIICLNESDIEQLDDKNLLIIKTISLYEYLYGGIVKIVHLDGEPIEVKFSSFIEDRPIKCLENKGLPFDDGEDDIRRGDLFIYFKIEGINNNENEIMVEYSEYMQKVLFNIFPPINQSN